MGWAGLLIFGIVFRLLKLGNETTLRLGCGGVRQVSASLWVSLGLLEFGLRRKS